MTRYHSLVEPRAWLAEALRYAVAGAIVVATCTGLTLAFSRGTTDEAASEVDSAVIIDLPPADASSQPASSAAEGPEQQAVQASPAQQAPEQVEPPKPVEELKPAEDPKPVEPAKPDPAPQPDTAPPPPVAPDPAAVLERKEDAAPPPKPVAAPPAPAQEERAPTGADAPTITAHVETSDEGRPHASKHAITLWQRSLVRRLEAAKRLIGSAPHAAGAASVAFHIDARGALVAERVASSSGSAALDKAAMTLVRMAAPFPAPPPGAGEREMFFVVPIRFR